MHRGGTPGGETPGSVWGNPKNTRKSRQPEPVPMDLGHGWQPTAGCNSEAMTSPLGGRAEPFEPRSHRDGPVTASPMGRRNLAPDAPMCRRRGPHLSFGPIHDTALAKRVGGIAPCARGTARLSDRLSHLWSTVSRWTLIDGKAAHSTAKRRAQRWPMGLAGEPTPPHPVQDGGGHPSWSGLSPLMRPRDGPKPATHAGPCRSHRTPP